MLKLGLSCLLVVWMMNCFVWLGLWCDMLYRYIVSRMFFMCMSWCVSCDGSMWCSVFVILLCVGSDMM